MSSDGEMEQFIAARRREDRNDEGGVPVSTVAEGMQR